MQQLSTAQPSNDLRLKRELSRLVFILPSLCRSIWQAFAFIHRLLADRTDGGMAVLSDIRERSNHFEREKKFKSLQSIGARTCQRDPIYHFFCPVSGDHLWSYATKFTVCRLVTYHQPLCRVWSPALLLLQPRRGNITTCSKLPFCHIFSHIYAIFILR